MGLKRRSCRCKIRDFHCDEDSSHSLLGCDTV